MSGWMLACWLAISAASPDPVLPTHNRYGEIVRDDSNGMLIVGVDWIGVGKVLPGGRTIHVMWTQRRRTDEIAFPAIYSWCSDGHRWVGYYGTHSEPYRTDERSTTDGVYLPTVRIGGRWRGRCLPKVRNA